MRRIERLPPPFEQFHRIGGVVDFGIFEDADGSDESIATAIADMLAPHGEVDMVLLRTGGRAMGKAEFLGDWYDPDAKALIKRGDWRTDKGVQLRDPALPTLEAVRIVSGGSSIPDAGTGGQFAYAFSSPPYSLQASPRQVQSLFDAILATILPPRMAGEIKDWSSPRLPDVSRYFAPGMEWWGVFLFSLYLPATRRLTIAMASTTD